jgi:recombination protein RecA
MNIKITGYTPKFRRVITGWKSFDFALADQDEAGFPLGQAIEIYGPNGIGKSTFVHSLSFQLANATDSNIALVDLEGVNVKLLTANAELHNYDGEFHILRGDKDETTLSDLLSCLRTKKYSVGIVDAVGSISPVAEVEGDLGDANMGRRAILMAQFSRKINHILLNNPDKSAILINHQSQRIGGIGTITPGGETKKFIASIRIQLTRAWYKKKEEVLPDGSYVIQGLIIKNRWGLENRKFYAFVLAGKGIHTGLTAMYDGMMAGIVTRDRTIKLGDRNFGYWKNVIDPAQNGDKEFYQPFIDALNTQPISELSEEETTDEEEK